MRRWSGSWLRLELEPPGVGREVSRLISLRVYGRGPDVKPEWALSVAFDEHARTVTFIAGIRSAAAMFIPVRAAVCTASAITY